jgi:pimeloyl-ACP methyl ester carboxylesterase
VHAAFHVQFGALLPSPIRLDREIDVGSLRLNVADWPGQHGPIVCVPHAGSSGRSFDHLASHLAPQWRVLAVDLHGSGYQVHVANTLALIDLFGFEQVVIIGTGIGGLVGLLMAAWHSERVAGLVRIEGDSPSQAPAVEREMRVLRDCPPDYPALAAAVACPRLDVEQAEPGLIASFLVTVPRRSTD